MLGEGGVTPFPGWLQPLPGLTSVLVQTCACPCTKSVCLGVSWLPMLVQVLVTALMERCCENDFSLLAVFLPHK